MKNLLNGISSDVTQGGGGWVLHFVTECYDEGGGGGGPKKLYENQK